MGRDFKTYKKTLARLIACIKCGEMHGEWTDYGRRLDY